MISFINYDSIVVSKLLKAYSGHIFIIDSMARYTQGFIHGSRGFLTIFIGFVAGKYFEYENTIKIPKNNVRFCLNNDCQLFHCQ